MADQWAEFQNAPTRPGTKPAPRPAADAWGEFRDAPTTDLRPTGDVHDGDTFRLTSGVNARLFGADAFELAQTGRTKGGVTIPLGQRARDLLARYATPAGMVKPTRAMTYGRPVVTLDNGGDAATSILHDGWAMATPEYLKADPARLTQYMEAERISRLNRRGAWATDAQQPASFRHGTSDPWAAPEAGKGGDGSIAVFGDEPMPMRALRPEIVKGYLGVWQDMASKPEDLIAYATASGFNVDPKIVREQYEKRDRDHAAGTQMSYLKPPKPLTDPKDGRFGATMRGFADPINMLDEMGAVVDSVVPGTERENIWSSDRRFGDVLANNLDQNRSILGFDDANHPYARLGGQLASGLAFPGLSIEGVGMAAARRVLQEGGSRFLAEQAAKSAVRTRLGVSGATEGFLAGFGQGETWQERAVGGGLGAPAGFALGTGAGILAPKAAELVGRPFSKMVGREGERVAGDFTNGAIDTARAGAQNDIATPGGMTVRDVNMDADFTVPTIYGPDITTPAGRAQQGLEAVRQARDAVASVSGTAAPESLVDAATRALGRLNEVRGVAADVRSGDFLPLPSNAIDGIEEAARIDAGRIVPVKAPDERAVLSGQPIPSAKSGALLRHKGPVDLVTWLRTQGGLKPQGGEMQWSGIDNTPRKMDFTGREGSYGPLVSETGMGFDDAAEAALSAGYFDKRPSVWDFVEAVKDTHAGRNRVFLRDDLDQIADFETQRAQRFAVEGAQQEGVPMAIDRGEPVDLADLDRNSAPVTAYEEWGENAPTMAGNINLDRLDSPEAIKRAIVTTHQRVGGFDAATRGRITHAETASLAADLGMTPDKLLARRKGQTLNAEEALASRQILARSSTDLVNMAKRIARIENPGDELEASFREAWLRHVAIQEQVAGMTAEAGRALSAFRAVADSRAVNGRVLPSLGDMPGGAARMKDVAARIVDMDQTGVGPGGIAQFAARSLWSRKRDMAMEYYYNSMLSGPQTHAVNMLSNTLTALGQIPEHAVAATIGLGRRALKGPEADRVLFGEVGSRMVGMLQGAREGLREATRTFLTGVPSNGVTKLELASQKAIPGKLGSVIRTPTRALAAEDEFFKAVARRMAINGLATRKVGLEGLSGVEARQRIANLTANPTEDMLEASYDYGRYLTFQSPLGQAGQAVGKFTEALPLAKLVVPFTRTPINILKFAMERSPAAPLLGEWRREFLAGGARRDIALARMAVGSGLAALVVQMAAAGQITGGGPADDSAKRLLQADGWQPYSFKVGDKYYSYARLDPYAMTLGTAADLVDVQSAMTEKQHEKVATLVAASVAKNLANKTWLSGMSGLVEAINDPDRSVDRFISNTISSLAVPAAVNQATRTVDPVLREARGPIDTIRSRLPGLSGDLPPRRDVFGQAVKRAGGLGPDAVTPVWTSTAKNDPVAKALLAAGVSVGKPQRKDMSDADYDRFQSEVGALAHRDLADLIRTAKWINRGDDDREKLADDVVSAARRAIKAQMGLVATAKRARGNVAPWEASDPVVSAPPPGFTQVVR